MCEGQGGCDGRVGCDKHLGVAIGDVGSIHRCGEGYYVSRYRIRRKAWYEGWVQCEQRGWHKESNGIKELKKNRK